MSDQLAGGGNLVTSRGPDVLPAFNARLIGLVAR
jgi:hypothetical protein